MPTRPRIAASAASDIDVIKAFCLSRNEDCTRTFFADAFPTRAEAMRAWPAARREVWGATYRMRVPRAAESFDGITRDGARLLLSSQVVTPFPLADILRALDLDVRHLDAFERKDRRGAKAIADYLAMWRDDLAAQIAIAHEISTDARTGAAHRLSTGRKYGTDA